MYAKAIQCFQENLQEIGESTRDPLIWNLSAGLTALAQAIRSDQAENRRLLQEILAATESR